MHYDRSQGPVEGHINRLKMWQAPQLRLGGVETPVIRLVLLTPGDIIALVVIVEPGEVLGPNLIGPEWSADTG
jgi:hypothetical protein